MVFGAPKSTFRELMTAPSSLMMVISPLATLPALAVVFILAAVGVMVALCVSYGRPTTPVSA